MNYLDLIPAVDHIEWDTLEDGKIVLKIENKGFFHRIAQKFFHKPKYRKVHLDDQGSYIWTYIDGKKTVMELARIQKEHFGEAVEPLYPRIVKYFQILESCHYIEFMNRKR